MIGDELQALMRHMEWADARTWSAVFDLPKARADTGMRERLHHVHLVQKLYLQIWQGEAPEFRELSTFANLSDLYGWSREFYVSVSSFLTGPMPQALDDELAFPWAAQLVEQYGEVGPANLRESILQVALHTTHHRGQISTRLRELGGEPPMTDFIVWVWMGKPEPSWPA
ncbi:MAG: DinB family protein [Gemmatimonadota bacterium]